MYETHNKTKLHIRNPKQLAGSRSIFFFFKCCTACFNSNCSTAVRHCRNHRVEGDKMSAFPDNQRSVLGHTPVYDCVSVASSLTRCCCTQRYPEALICYRERPERISRAFPSISKFVSVCVCVWCAHWSLPPRPPTHSQIAAREEALEEGRSFVRVSGYLNSSTGTVSWVSWCYSVSRSSSE